MSGFQTPEQKPQTNKQTDPTTTQQTERLVSGWGVAAQVCRGQTRRTQARVHFFLFLNCLFLNCSFKLVCPHSHCESLPYALRLTLAAGRSVPSGWFACCAGVLIIASLGCTIPRRTPRALSGRLLRSRRELEYSLTPSLGAICERRPIASRSAVLSAILGGAASSV